MEHRELMMELDAADGNIEPPAASLQNDQKG
jgi:hypothetical protein